MDVETAYEDMLKETRKAEIASEVDAVLRELLKKFAQQRALDTAAFGTQHAAVHSWETAMFLVERAISLQGNSNS